MRCNKARGLYLRNRDGLLDESGRMKLQEHLNVCGSCAGYVTEMDQCLDLLGDLSECCPSENFEWNLKRRIVQEKARLVRINERRYFGEWTWGVKFIASAAAAVLIVLSGVVYLSDAGDRPGRVVQTPAAETRVPGPGTYMPRDMKDIINVGMTDRIPKGLQYPPGLKMVSQNPMGYDGRNRYMWNVPYRINTMTSADSLIASNILLMQRLARVERENLMLRQTLLLERGRN